MLRIATFNLESFGADRLAERVPLLARQIAGLRADVLCLQEVDASKRDGRRRLDGLDALLAAAGCGDVHRVSTLSPDGEPADVHNLVVASRRPIVAVRQIRHDLVAPPLHRPVTAIPPAPAAVPICWERPVLEVEIDVGGRRLHVLDLHLRAPLAAPVAGQKAAAGRWRSAAGWAEGYFIAAVKRSGQALEARLAVDRLLDADAEALIVVAGDLNAGFDEMPTRILVADTEETGDPALSGRVLHPAERLVPPERRFTVIHRGRPLLLDHLLLSPALRARLVDVDIANAALADEAEAGAKPVDGSFHAPMVAEFDL